MDDRFYTPRQSALSSRSSNSDNMSVGTRSFATPRDTMMSARSNRSRDKSISSSGSESFRTPRATLSPVGSSIYASGDRRRLPHRPASAYVAPSYSYAPPELSKSTDDIENGTETRSGPKRTMHTNIFSLARHGRVGEMEELLLRGIPVSTQDENGNTALHIGSQNNKKKVVKLLLKYGADINAVNNTGNTSLHFVLKYGHQTLGQYLMSKGADPNIRNNDGRLCTEV